MKRYRAEATGQKAGGVVIEEGPNGYGRIIARATTKADAEEIVAALHAAQGAVKEAETSRKLLAEALPHVQDWAVEGNDGAKRLARRIVRHLRGQ